MPTTQTEPFTFVCGCEMNVHFKDEFPSSEWHDYGAKVSGPIHFALEVGEICDDCARTHYAHLVINDPFGDDL